MKKDKNRSVVIVDDDPDFINLLRRRLEKRDITVRGYASAGDVLASSDVKDASVTLIDLGICDPSGAFWEYAGLEVICELRRQYGPDPQIWVVTGQDCPAALASCLNNGASDIVLKHHSFDRITERIVSAVDARRAAPPSAA